MSDTLHLGDWILIASGIFFLFSTLVIALGGEFTFNLIAKLFYVSGVVIFALTQ
ncbi:MAG: hypothetical protein WDZ70_01300 [Candidatus Paceibacterota bacterium]